MNGFTRRWRRPRRAPAVVAVTVLGAAAAVFAGPSAATADTPATIRADRAQVRKCHQAPADGRGVTAFTVTAPSTGLLRVRLNPVDNGAVGADWDLAVFDEASGRVVAASAGLRSYEIADGYVTVGDRLRVQGCREAGNAGSVNVSVAFVAVPAAVTAKVAADPVQVVEVDTPSRADKTRLQQTELDLTEAATDTTVDVVLHGRADAARLSAARFDYRVKIDNLADYLADVRKSDAAYAARTPRSDLPSGRTSYRRLADYDWDLKDLARRYPLLAKTFLLDKRSVEGRDIAGLEIAPFPQYTDDGRPIFLNMGVHHAREWPAGEHTIEWAFDLLGGYGHDARTTQLVNATRNIVVPIVNPDGFSVSREAQPLGDFSTFDYEMKRKNCTIEGAPAAYQTGLCPQNPAGRTRGTDLNRNYAGFWGGPGASTNWRSDTFRGVAPFSEPETQAIRDLISGRQVTNIITNHTYSNLVLRPPGVLATGQPVDEPLMAQLGADMASHNDYANIRGWQLYDTTGSTEDWSYWNTGGLAYTFEIGPLEFHPTYEVGVVDEYLGRAPAVGAGKGGNREAYFAMLQSTANSGHHSTLTGVAPPGWTLRLHKTFQTPTSPVINPDGTTGPAILYTDTLDTTFQPWTGRFSWAVNPSTRPFVAGRYGHSPVAPPQANFTFANPPGQPAENPNGGPTDGPREEIPFTLLGPPAADNGEVHVKVTWTDPNTDWDLYILDEGNHTVAQSATFGTNFEDAILIDPPPGNYRAVLINFDQIDGSPTYDDWLGGTVTFSSPTPPVAGVREAWTLTCERPNGSIANVKSVIVDRGQTLDVGNVCFDRKHKK